jgi:exonuclease III
MIMDLRITTFNCENLFGRYQILDKPPAKPVTNYEGLLHIGDVVTLKEDRSGTVLPTEISREQRKNTGNAVLGADPHLLAVEEVENLATLRQFNSKYMNNSFDRILLIDGNDARGIDVGFLVRKGVDARILEIRTHVDDAIDGGYLVKSNRLDTKVTGQAVFSRDCLEVDVRVNETVLTFLVNHLKAQDGKPSSTARRLSQATRVAELAKIARDGGKYPIVMGDLNIDTKQVDYDNSLDPLVNLEILHDPFAGLSNDERWTHFFSSKHEVSRLDYILIDERLEPRVQGTDIFRKGLSKKCKQYAGPRLDSMKTNDLEASDHCPTTVILQV